VSRGGPTFVPALVALLAGAAVLFVASATWLRTAAALVLLAGAALAVFAIATPQFVGADADDDEQDE
jgi:hypothetical protein